MHGLRIILVKVHYGISAKIGQNTSSKVLYVYLITLLVNCETRVLTGTRFTKKPQKIELSWFYQSKFIALADTFGLVVKATYVQDMFYSLVINLPQAFLCEEMFSTVPWTTKKVGSSNLVGKNLADQFFPPLATLARGEICISAYESRRDYLDTAKL